MKLKDIDGQKFALQMSAKIYIMLEPCADDGRIILDRKRAKRIGELLIHFAATGRLTRRGK